MARSPKPERGFHRGERATRFFHTAVSKQTGAHIMHHFDVRCGRGSQPPPVGSQAAEQFKTDEAIDGELTAATDQRMWALACAFARGDTVDSLYDKTKINPWFLCKLRDLHLLRLRMAEYTLDGMPRDLMLHAKQQGFCDAQIAQALDATEGPVAVDPLLNS